jgi:hypothetical protein
MRRPDSASLSPAASSPEEARIAFLQGSRVQTAPRVMPDVTPAALMEQQVIGPGAPGPGLRPVPTATDPAPKAGGAGDKEAKSRCDAIGAKPTPTSSPLPRLRSRLGAASAANRWSTTRAPPHRPENVRAAPTADARQLPYRQLAQCLAVPGAIAFLPPCEAKVRLPSSVLDTTHAVGAFVGRRWRRGFTGGAFPRRRLRVCATA